LANRLRANRDALPVDRPRAKRGQPLINHAAPRVVHNRTHPHSFCPFGGGCAGRRERSDKVHAYDCRFFQKNGYSTYFSGKWHLGDKPEAYPIEHGFDEMKNFAAYYAGVYTYDFLNKWITEETRHRLYD
jgi:arylsulfatase A-like enzyme